MTNERPKNEMVPYHAPISPQKVDNSAWVPEDDGFESLEDLLSLVEESISRGGYTDDFLKHKYLPGGREEEGIAESSSGQPTLDYIRHKSARSYVGIRHLHIVIFDAVYYITRNREEYPGKAVRLVSIVETIMLHYGLHGLDMLLSNRPKVIEDRLEAIRLGDKERRRRGQAPEYTWVVFTEGKEKQQNITCLIEQDYARATTIATDYDWTLSFVVQIALILAIAGSQRLPNHTVKDAKEEVRYFQEYLEKHY